MIGEEPALRMSLAELLEHPWLNEDVATEEEVIEEMQNWVNQTGLVTPDADKHPSNPSAFEYYNLYCKFGGYEYIEFEKLIAKPYKEGISKLNFFFSTTEPLELLNVLFDYFNE